MFDSPWFHAALEKYGAPKAEDLQLAMETQKKARAAASITVAVQVAPPVAVAAPPVQTQIAPVKLKGRKPKEAAEKKPDAEKPAAEKKPAAAPKEKKTTAPRGKKAVATVMTVPQPVVAKAVEVVPDTAMLMETTDEPLQVKDVIEVILKPFTHNGVRYWRDSCRDKIYKRTSDGKRGPYIGRWDIDLQELNRDAPDSDDD